MASLQFVFCFVVVLFCVVHTIGCEALKAKENEGVFRCRDGSKTIASHQVDDDYCDCADGSDEPHTSACIMIWGERIIEQGKGAQFKCANTGDLEQYIPTHWLHDGFCDCCDGSDENPELVKCPNTCGQAARDRAQRIKEEEDMRKIAAKVKAKMTKQANADRANMKKELPALEKAVAKWDKDIEEHQSILASLEQKEQEERAVVQRKHDEWRVRQSEYVKGCIGWRQTQNCDPQGERETYRDLGCAAEVREGQSGYCECGEAARDGEEEGGLRREPGPLPEGRSGSVELEAIRSRLKKQAADEERAETQGQPLDEEDGEDGGGLIDLDERDSDDGGGVDDDLIADSGEVTEEQHAVKDRVLYNFTCDHKPLHCAYVCHNGGEVGTLPDLVEPTRAGAYKLHEASLARSKMTELKDGGKEAADRLNEARERLSTDLNTGDLLHTLEGQTFLFDFQEYTYELKLFKGVWQNRKHAASESGTLIGSWGSFAQNTYSSWAKDKYDYSQMNYPNGVKCWNGVVRSTELHVVCGAESKLVHMEEPAMCRYRLVFETPAICEDEK